MIKLLLLTCGTNACFHIAKILKEKFPKDFVIVGTDINKRWKISSCKYLDKFYQSPYSMEGSYYDFILSVCKKEKIDYLLPSFDNDQFLFYPENKDLKTINVQSLGTRKKTLDSFYKNKSTVNEFYMKNGIPIPQTYTLECLEADKEYFVKPKNGTGSIGAQCLYGRNIHNDTDLIQELCMRPEITVECFYDGTQLSTIARTRIEVKSGVCTKAKIFHSVELESIAQQIISKIALPYCFNFQFMKNASGQFVVTDTNLRFAGGMSLSYCAGWDEVSALAKVMLKRKGVFDTLKQIDGMKYVVRAYTDILTKESKKKIAFDLDGTLLDSRRRHSLVMNDVLHSFGLHIDTTDLVKFKSTGKNNIDFLIKNGIEKYDAENIQKKWIEKIEDECYLETDVLYENVCDMLSALSQKNDLYLLTARKNQESVLSQLKKFGLNDFFEEILVVSPDNVVENKSRLLLHFGISEFIGDTILDYNAAKMAGIDFYAVKHGFHDFSNNKEIKFFEHFSLII